MKLTTRELAIIEKALEGGSQFTGCDTMDDYRAIYMLACGEMIDIDVKTGCLYVTEKGKIAFEKQTQHERGSVRRGATRGTGLPAELLVVMPRRLDDDRE